MEWYIGVLKKYAVFTGRARRKEFWMFALFDIIVSTVLYILATYILVDIKVLFGWLTVYLKYLTDKSKHKKINTKELVKCL